MSVAPSGTALSLGKTRRVAKSRTRKNDTRNTTAAQAIRVRTVPIPAIQVRILIAAAAIRHLVRVSWIRGHPYFYELQCIFSNWNKYGLWDLLPKRGKDDRWMAGKVPHRWRRLPNLYANVTMCFFLHHCPYVLGLKNCLQVKEDYILLSLEKVDMRILIFAWKAMDYSANSKNKAFALRMEHLK